MLADLASSPWLGVTMLSCLAVSMLGGGCSNLALPCLTMVQGSWLFHSAQLSTLSPLHYSWHLTGVFIANITITAAIRHLTSRSGKETPAPSTPSTSTTTTSSIPRSVTSTTSTSSSPSNPTGLVVELQRDSSSSVGSVESGLDTSSLDRRGLDTSSLDRGLDTTSLEPEERRVSPLEEFNTLHRHTEGVRRSIKLKESSIV